LVAQVQAIKAFLKFKTHPDLADMYDYCMECQVNVAQDKGERNDYEYQGRRIISYTDGVQNWKQFRIPFNAATKPEYDLDKEMKFDLNEHAEGIGMTGWDWINCVSKWVAFDFDAILGHSDNHKSKLTTEELIRVRDAACNIPWVTVRNSTSGKGLHLYVFLHDVPTSNHTEHAALARSILAKMYAETGFDFVSKVDICGGNMWVWHRKMIGTEGLKLIKDGDYLEDIPVNWRDHLDVIKGSSRKIKSPLNSSGDIDQKFDILVGQRNRIPLDDKHKELIKYLDSNGMYSWWDADRHMLVTHTAHLRTAHKELNLRGLFETDTQQSSTHNCFLFPMRRGAWSVRRFSPGCREHASWEQDGAGWTRCYFNHDPTLRSAAFAFGGLEDPAGGYQFERGRAANQAAEALGARVDIPTGYDSRPAILKMHKDGRLVVEFDYNQSDEKDLLKGWLQKGKKWIKMFQIARVNQNEVDVENYDDTVRHVVTGAGADGGWVLSSENKWIEEPLKHIQLAMSATGLKDSEIKAIVGASVAKPWTLVQQPFQPEYPGDRLWNRNAPQFKFPPAIGDVLYYPTWDNMLTHLGKGLNPVIESDPWCKANYVRSGADYLKLWIASMFQFPFDALPYLFIYGEKQNTGKSTLHEALELLFYPGCVRADHALKNPNTFNGELEGAILCVVEETDLGKQNTQAYTRIKDWVTGKTLSVHHKHVTPYLVPNTTHWMQFSNNRADAPCFPGDTRMTYIYVDALEKEIPKHQFLRLLEKEGPDFLAAVLNLEIPEPNSRLRIPFLDTGDKQTAMSLQQNMLHIFIDEKCYYAPGQMITLNEFYETFLAWCDPQERLTWHSKQKVSKEMPSRFPKGRNTADMQWCWGNISFKEPSNPDARPLVCVNQRLVQS
jgi:hypothetical protein